MAKKAKILLVDDDADFVESTKTVLESKPYEVIVADDGDEAGDLSTARDVREKRAQGGLYGGPIRASVRHVGSLDGPAVHQQTPSRHGSASVRQTARRQSDPDPHALAN